MLTFDAEKHEYRFNGMVVPSVTTLMKPLYDFSFVDELTMEIACKRGTEVHLACEMYDRDELDESSLEGWQWIKYFEAWKKFRAESGYVPILTEERVYHPILKYAGTLDSQGILQDKPAILDRKTTASLSPAIGIQLVGYEEALKANPEWKGPTKMHRYAVQLRADGAYRLQPYTNTTDYAAFVSLMNLRNWMNNNNVKGAMSWN